MQRSAKHWLNLHLLAPNVLEIDVATSLLGPAEALTEAIQGIKDGDNQFAPGGDLSFDIARPPKWHSDIAWITPADAQTFTRFAELFDALGIAAHVAERIAVDSGIVLYTPMFVTRRTCDAAFFHEDWIGTDNNAFTFLTPLGHNHDAIGLNYRNVRGAEALYAYQRGKGLVFGDRFSHATAPGQSDKPAVLLAFQFGTDQMASYDAIKRSTYNGRFHRRPDGRFVRDDVVVT